MINYETLYSEIHQHTTQLSTTLADKRKQLDNNNEKATKEDYRQLAQIEKEINLNYSILKSLMKLSLVQKMEKLEKK